MNNGQGWPLGQPPSTCTKTRYLTTCLTKDDLRGISSFTPYSTTNCPLGKYHYLVPK